MTVVHCPMCCEQVTVPEAATGQMRVRCPLCQEEYQLTAALAALPPELIVIDESAELPTVSVAATEAIFEKEGDLGLLAEIDIEGTEPEVPAFEFEAPRRTKTSVRASQRRRRQRSAFGEIFKVVAGGVVGLAIGQVILWWGVKRDPFELGPRVSRLAPWAVPVTFHDPTLATSASEQSLDGLMGLVATLGSDSNDDQTLAHEESVRQTATESPGIEADEQASGPKPAAPDTVSDLNDAAVPDPRSNLDPELPSDPTAKLPSDSARESNIGAATQSSLDLGPEPIVEPSESLDTVAAVEQPGELVEEQPAEEPTVDSPTPEVENTHGDIAEPTTRSEPSPTVDGPAGDPAVVTDSDTADQLTFVSDLPKLTDADVVIRMEAARRATAAWDNRVDANTLETRGLAAQFYRSLARLGEAVTVTAQTERSNPEYCESVLALLQELDKDDVKIEMIRKVATSWMASRGDRHGVLLSGIVRSVSQSGDLFETQLEIRPQRIVTLVSARDPSECCLPESRVMVFGLIVDNPTQNLLEYDGSEDQVVVVGFQATMSQRRRIDKEIK